MALHLVRAMFLVWHWRIEGFIVFVAPTFKFLA